MWWRKKKDKPQFNQILNYTCPSCSYQIKAPKDFIDQFKPGGREYHPGGQSYLNCPKCGKTIEIK